MLSTYEPLAQLALEEFGIQSDSIVADAALWMERLLIPTS
jgi:hypothetical protein